MSWNFPWRLFATSCLKQLMSGKILWVVSGEAVKVKIKRLIDCSFWIDGDVFLLNVLGDERNTRFDETPIISCRLCSVTMSSSLESNSATEQTINNTHCNTLLVAADSLSVLFATGSTCLGSAFGWPGRRPATSSSAATPATDALRFVFQLPTASVERIFARRMSVTHESNARLNLLGVDGWPLTSHGVIISKKCAIRLQMARRRRRMAVACRGACARARARLCDDTVQGVLWEWSNDNWTFRLGQVWMWAIYMTRKDGERCNYNSGSTRKLPI